tara:strand:+ start:599 stop:1168 length:570 start_codon:yes stop_codon:yes gene_type:complete
MKASRAAVIVEPTELPALGNVALVHRPVIKGSGRHVKGRSLLQAKHAETPSITTVTVKSMRLVLVRMARQGLVVLPLVSANREHSVVVMANGRRLAQTVWRQRLKRVMGKIMIVTVLSMRPSPVPAMMDPLELPEKDSVNKAHKLVSMGSGWRALVRCNQQRKCVTEKTTTVTARPMKVYKETATVGRS